MRMHHRHRTRNIAIGSIIAAAGAGSAAYAIYKFTKGKGKKDNDSRLEPEDIKIVQSANDVLLNKIGTTNSEIEEAKHTHKTAYDLAKDKGFSEEQFKMFVNQERTRGIDELVLNRKISDEVGEQVKQKIIQHTNSWDGMLC
ncbi:hypothetical protein HMPREF1982_00889 [Clostridiales bacterium oral taxon 876 str. F0540]|nr:hypothetical protein HMPREF1982_00889 [Clostridiales bacterium oral taxon 876 str. F0540]